MNKFLNISLLLGGLLFAGNSFGQCSGTYVILKMDDVRANSGSMYNAAWQRYADTIRSYGVKSGMGAVTVDLTTGSQQFKDSLTSWHNSDYFEVWHHGWDHIRNNYPPSNNNAGEFSGTPYDYQKDHFEDGMTYGQSELGITFRSFGAPYNQTDATFLTVLEENSDVKVWLYCNDPSYSGLCLERGSSNLLESSTGVVSYSSFLTAYGANTNPYLVLQGHPGQWDDNSFDEFEQVIDYVESQGDCIVLPYEYYQIVNNVNVVYAEDFDNSDTVYLTGGLTKLDASQSCCGELKLEVKAGQTLSMNEPIIHPIHSEGVLSSVDISNNKKVYLRLRSENAMDIRVDLSDGNNSTDGVNGQVTQSVAADLDGWTTLVYDFSVASFSDNGVDSTSITEIHLYPDPTSDNFSGAVYIDYISIGDANGTVAQCRTDLDADPCTSIFEDQFDDEIVTVSGSHLANIDATESECGELKLEMKSGATLGAYQPILYNFPSPIDFTQNPKLVVRVRCATSFPLRFDLHDGTNATNGVSGRVSNTIPADINNWTELEYNYSSMAFSENNVDSTAITRVNIQLDAANANFPGPVYIDFIAVGEPSGLGNAVGKTDLDCGINGVDNEYEGGFMIYPNPARNELRIGSQSSEKLNVTIADLLGKTHLSESNYNVDTPMDISTLKTGTYIIVANDELNGKMHQSVLMVE